MTFTILVSTWSDGLFLVTETKCDHEMAGRPVRALSTDGDGGVFAVVDQGCLYHRPRYGRWIAVIESDFDLACAVRAGNAIYIGTNDARMFRVAEGSSELEPLPGFDTMEGRDTWYAGTAVINGKTVGPPLGVRSLATSSDQNTLLASIHVGGIARSTDGGETWHPTIDIDTDIHEVATHSSDPELAAAASAVGLCISRDGGASWSIERDGLHADYGSAVAFCGDQILIATAADHFAPEAAIYTRSARGPDELSKVQGGLPTWLAGIADTRLIATRGSDAALVDRMGHVYVSRDRCRTWTQSGDGIPGPSSALIV